MDTVPTHDDDEIAQAIELLANLSDEDRLLVLRHFHDELVATTQASHLPGGGMSSGSMVVPEIPRTTPPMYP